MTGATSGIVAATSSGPITIVLGGGVTITGTSTFGISSVSTGGNVIVDTSTGDMISSGTSGINAQDQATTLAPASNSSISISAYGTIDSGATAATATNDPAAIRVAYTNGTADTPTTAVSGSITINNNANINATWGSGLYAFDYGLGNISITDATGTTITTSTAAPPAGSSQYGIGAFGYEAGNTDVTVASGSTITSGSTGINAVNQATAIPQAETSGVSVIALGSINSGTNDTNSGFSPSGIQAGFNPGTGFDQNVYGNTFVDFGGSIVANAGEGIRAFNYGIGNVTVAVSGNSGISALTSGTSAKSDNSPYGIGAFNYGPGNILVTTSNGDSINSGSSGIEVVNEATTTVGYPDPVITVSASGTINSGTIATNSGALPSGISAGFLGGTSEGVNPNVDGSVVVNNSANITAAAGFGINAYNYGDGDVTVNDAGVMVSGAQTGINATAEGGGAGDIAINLSANVKVTGTTGFGILATSFDTGNILVTTSSGDTISSSPAGSAAIDAVNEASTVGPGSSIIVNASGTINSGSALTGSGHSAAGIVASYNRGLADPVGGSSSVQGDISITDFATINATTAGTDGIRGDNYGIGTITIVAEAGATISAGEYGIAAFGYDGGDVSVTNYATVTGATAAIDATTTSTGTVTIDNYGHLTGDVISYNASFTNEAAGVWSLNGISAFTGVSNLVNDGDLQSNGTSEISGLSGITNSGTIEVQSGSLKLDAGILGTGTLTIDAGATLEPVSGVSSGQTVIFSSTTGMLKLDQAENFNGVVSGFSTTDGTLANSDQIDLADINHHSSSFSEQFNSTTDTLTVTDGTKTAVIHFTGNVGNLDFADDGNLVGGVSGTSGTIVYDPPSASQSVGPVVMHDPGQGVTPVTMQDPGAAPSTIVATAANQTLSGFAASDNFVFNFAGVGHTTVTDFHPLSDTLQFGNSIFANAQAVLNATQDDGHGNTVIAVDNHDFITLGGVLKAQLHAADFHIV